MLEKLVSDGSVLRLIQKQDINAKLIRTHILISR